MTNLNMIYFYSYRLFEDELEVDISILQAPNCCPWLVSCQVLHSTHHPSQAPRWSWRWAAAVAWDGQLDQSLVLTLRYIWTTFSRMIGWGIRLNAYIFFQLHLNKVVVAARYV